MNILHSLNRSLITNIVLNIFLVVLWWLPYTGGLVEIKPVTISIFGVIDIVNLQPFFFTIIKFLTSIFAFLLLSIFFFPRFVSIISYLPFSVMFLLFALVPSTPMAGNNTIAALCALIAFWNLTKIDFTKDNTSEILNMIILLIISSVFQVDFVLLLPLFVIGVFILEGIKWRSMMLMIFVIVVSLLTFWGYAYVFNSMPIIDTYYRQLLDFQISTYSLPSVLNAIPLFILTAIVVVALILYFGRQNRLNFKIKKTILYMVFIWVFLTIYMLIFEDKQYMFSIFYISIISLFLSLNFTEYRFKINNNLFIFLSLLLLISYLVRILYSVV